MEWFAHAPKGLKLFFYVNYIVMLYILSQRALEIQGSGFQNARSIHDLEKPPNSGQPSFVSTSAGSPPETLLVGNVDTAVLYAKLSA